MLKKDLKWVINYFKLILLKKDLKWVVKLLKGLIEDQVADVVYGKMLNVQGYPKRMSW